MRIGIDAHAAEREGTGNCTYTRNTILHLANIDTANQYILFVTDTNHPFYKNFEKRANFQIVQIRRSPAWMRVFFSLPAASRRLGIDILHIQYFAPIGSKGRLINTIHDLASFRYPQYFSRSERLLFKLLLPRSSRKASFVITVSEVSKKDIIHYLGLTPERIRVVYNGVDTALREPREQREIQTICSRYGLDGKFILCVGRIDPRKNLVRLIQSYSILRKKFPPLDHKLAIAGSVHLEPELLRKTVDQSEFRSDIHFCGYVPDQHLPALYQGSDVFVYVSEYEGFGLPPLEAMASGTPVIASEIPVFREVLSDAALLVNPYDHEAMANAMYRLLTDPNLRATLVQKGRELSKKYSWKESAEITLQCYQEAMKHPA